MTAVIPTFNRAHLVREAVESAVGQDYEPLEVVVVDDGSTDATSEVIEELRRKAKSQIRVICQSNAGVSAARNAGILAATHDLVAFLDSDNRWHEGKLAEQIAFLTKGSYRFSFTAYNEFGPGIAGPKIIQVDNWQEDPMSTLRRLLVGCLVNTSTVIAHRDVLTDAGLFDPSLQCCEDHDLWMKIATRGNRFGYLDVPLTDYRVHQESLSQQNALVASSTERVMESLFREADLPFEIESEKSVHLSRCYLNSAHRYIEARRPNEARRALWRAAVGRPTAIRLGWLRMLLSTLQLELRNRRSRDGTLN